MPDQTDTAGTEKTDATTSESSESKDTKDTKDVKDSTEQKQVTHTDITEDRIKEAADNFEKTKKFIGNVPGSEPKDDDKADSKDADDTKDTKDTKDIKDTTTTDDTKSDDKPDSKIDDSKASDDAVKKLTDSIDETKLNTDIESKPETFTKEDVQKLLDEQRTKIESEQKTKTDDKDAKTDDSKTNTPITLTDDEFDDIMSGRENFEKFLTKFREDTILSSSEVTLKSLGPAMMQAIKSQIEITNAAKKMFSANEDLVPFTSDIATVADKIAALNPSADINDIMSAAADVVRKKKNLSKTEPDGSQPNGSTDSKTNVNKGKFPGGSGSNSDGKKLSDMKTLDSDEARIQESADNFNEHYSKLKL